MGFEPEVLERIKFHKRSTIQKEITTLLPLLFGVGLCTAIIVVAMRQNRFWLYNMLLNVNETAARVVIAGLFLLIGLITLGTVFAKLRREKHPFEPAATYDEREFAGFRSALEGVAVASGKRMSHLLVLDIPAANAIAFDLRGEPAIGVTPELLAAHLDSAAKEAIMAHEMARIALGDYFLASSSARFEALARSLAVLFFLLAVVAVVVVNPLLLFLLIAEILIFSFVAVLLGVRKRSGEVQVHNAILADSLASQVTMNPAALREAIGFVDSYVRQAGPVSTTSGYPSHLFVPVQRSWGILQGLQVASPRQGQVSLQVTVSTDDDISNWEEQAAQARSAVGRRVENLQAIESGRASPLEEPLASEKRKTTAALAVTVAVVVALTLTLALPWEGKSRAWDFISTNWILEKVAKSRVETAERMTSSIPSYQESLEAMRTFLHAKSASGSLALTISEDVELSINATSVMALADITKSMNDNARSHYSSIRYYAPGEDYVEYSKLKTEEVDLENSYASAAKQFASEVERLFVINPPDAQAVAAALQAFEARRQEILPRLEVVRARAAELARELDLQ